MLNDTMACKSDTVECKMTSLSTRSEPKKTQTSYQLNIIYHLIYKLKFYALFTFFYNHFMIILNYKDLSLKN